MRKGLIVAVLAGFAYSSVALSAEMVRYERDYYADEAQGQIQKSTPARYNQGKPMKKGKEARFDNLYRTSHPINWAGPERD